MTITKIDIHLFNEIEDKNQEKNLLALVDIDLDYNYRIHDIKLMSGNKGEYIVFPTNQHEKYVAYPISNDFREYILSNIVSKFNEDFKNKDHITSI